MATMLTQQIALRRNSGLNLRASQRIVSAATQHRSTISILAGQRMADAKSALELLTLAAECGTVLSVEVIGEDAPDAMRHVISIIDECDDDDARQVVDGLRETEVAETLSKSGRARAHATTDVK